MSTLKNQVSSKVSVLTVTLINANLKIWGALAKSILLWVSGEGINVLATIQNKSNREIKPKYCIYRKHSFFAKGKRRLDTKDLFKEVGEAIPPSASQTVKRVITIPHDVEPSILNCKILKAEYRLRVRFVFVFFGLHLI